MKEYLENSIQQKIYDLIAKEPGLHLTKIAEILNMKLTEVAYHLQYLEKKEIISFSEKEGCTGYYIKQKKELGLSDRRSQEIRMLLFNLISDNPGLHLSKIAEMLNINLSLAKYHLLYMKKNNLIIEVNDKSGYYKRFYLKDNHVGVRDKEILSLLRQKSLFKIVILLLKDNSLKHKEILENVDMAPSTLSYHLTRLVNSGIVEMTSFGKDKGYKLNDKEEIIRILKKYRIHVEFQMTIENLKDTWKDFNII